MATVDFVGDDFFERALREYREATWNDSEFSDLPREAQHAVLERTQQLKDREERENVFAA